jgi:hypothetical protein
MSQKELQTNIDKSSVSKLAECFVLSVQEYCSPSCNSTGLLDDSDSGGLDDRGVYPFSVADPVKLEGSGWLIGDKVVNSCGDIFELIDPLIPVPDPDLHKYFRDGTSREETWLNLTYNNVWQVTHPSSPFSKLVEVITDKLQVSGYSAYLTTQGTKSSIYTNLLAQLPLTTGYLVGSTFLEFTNTNITVTGVNLLEFRLGLLEATTDTFEELVIGIASCVNHANLSNIEVLLVTPINSPTVLIQAYKKVSIELNLPLLLSSVPIDSSTNTLVNNNSLFMQYRVTHWVLNEVLPSGSLNSITMSSPAPSDISVRAINKHLDIDMVTG